jgi:hypothetical protein
MCFAGYKTDTCRQQCAVISAAFPSAEDAAGWGRGNERKDHEDEQEKLWPMCFLGYLLNRDSFAGWCLNF